MTASKSDSFLDGLKLVGIVTSNARASMAPIRVLLDHISFVRDEMLVVVEDVEEERLYLGVIKGSTKKDIVLDGSALPVNFNIERSLGSTAPIMVGFVELVGEIVDGHMELSFSIPKPGSRVYVVTRNDSLSRLLKLPEGLHVGFHKFSDIRIDLDPRALDYHIAVLGATGTGKSRLVKAIIEEVLARTGYSVIVFDHTGVDYSDRSRWHVDDIVIVDGSRIVLTPDVIADIMAEKMRIKSDWHAEYLFGSLTLYILRQMVAGHSTDRASSKRDLESSELENLVKSYLLACSNNSFKWSFEEFLRSMNNYLSTVGARDHTKHKLELLISLRVGRSFFEDYLQKRNIVIGDVVEELLSRRSRLVIVDLSGEIEYEAKKYVVYQFLREIWDKVLEAGERAEIVAVIDEAHNYACARGCDPSMDMIARTAREGRKWGFGLILASQRVIDLAPDIRGNINTVFFSKVQSAGDYEELKRWIEGIQFIEYTLPLLARKEFYLSGLGNPLRKPVLVKVRDVD